MVSLINETFYLSLCSLGVTYLGQGRGRRVFPDEWRRGNMSFLKRYGQVGKSHESRSALWTGLPKYHGPQHEDLRQQCLAEFFINHPEQSEHLQEAEVEAIRRGCILLNDALEGRASHGLHSLLDEPRWKSVLFQIQTSEAWQHVVLGGSFLHALLIAFEAPNWRAAHLDPAFEAPSLLLAEILIICVYVADAVMKMLYFGGKCRFPHHQQCFAVVLGCWYEPGLA